MNEAIQLGRLVHRSWHMRTLLVDVMGDCLLYGEHQFAKLIASSTAQALQSIESSILSRRQVVYPPLKPNDLPVAHDRAAKARRLVGEIRRLSFDLSQLIESGGKYRDCFHDDFIRATLGGLKLIRLKVAPMRKTHRQRSHHSSKPE